MRCRLMLLVVVMTGMASADNWRWTDEDGKVHYSDSPPPTGQPAEQIELPEQHDRSPDEKANARRERALDILQEHSQQQHREEQAAASRREVERQQECHRRRRQLTELERSPPLMRKDFQGLLYEEYKAHERKKQALGEWLDENCSITP